LDDDFNVLEIEGRENHHCSLLDHTSGMEADMGEEIEFFDMLTNQGLPHNSIAKNV
jgi:hypothetical protein